MELVDRQIVITVKLTSGDATELAALLEGIDRVRLSYPNLVPLLTVGYPTLVRLVGMVD